MLMKAEEIGFVGGIRNIIPECLVGFGTEEEFLLRMVTRDITVAKGGERGVIQEM